MPDAAAVGMTVNVAGLELSICLTWKGLGVWHLVQVLGAELLQAAHSPHHDQGALQRSPDVSEGGLMLFVCLKWKGVEPLLRLLGPV